VDQKQKQVDQKQEQDEQLQEQELHQQLEVIQERDVHRKPDKQEQLKQQEGHQNKDREIERLHHVYQHHQGSTNEKQRTKTRKRSGGSSRSSKMRKTSCRR